MKFKKISYALVAIICTIDAYGKDMPSNIKEAWGSPTLISESWSRGKGHDSSTNMPDQTFWMSKKVRADNANDEAIVIVYMARQVVEHGGYFCATQLRSRNSGKSGCPNIWTQYQNPTGDFERTCFWLCEPGYTGENCVSGKAKSADACKYTNLSAATLLKDIGFQQTGGYDTATVESAIHDAGARFFYSNTTRKSDESDVILLAKEYLENGHGIVASPATFSAHGGMWNAENYSDEWLDCKYGDSNLTVTANGGGYTTKKLCMPGFDGEDCTTTYCKTCDDTLAKYNDKTGSCSDCIENHIRNKEGKCEKCPAGTTAVQDKKICLECKKTEYVKDGECVPRDVIEKSVLYNCYPNENANDFKACVSSTCTNDAKVKCVTAQKQIGTKKCTGGKWGTCTK